MKRDENQLVSSTTSYIVVNDIAISEQACNQITALYHDHKERIEHDSQFSGFSGKISRVIRDIASSVEGMGNRPDQPAKGMALTY